MRMEPSLVLIRGLPGSGKSTFAKKLTDHVHLEADQFMVDEDYNKELEVGLDMADFEEASNLDEEEMYSDQKRLIQLIKVIENVTGPLNIRKLTLLAELQKVHDSSEMENWEYMLANIAYDFNLVMPEYDTGIINTSSRSFYMENNNG